MKEKLAKLIDVKSIVTFVLTGVFAYLYVTNQNNPELTTIYTMIMGFYFGTQFRKGQEGE